MLTQFLAEIENPFKDLTPKFDIFGDAFDTLWKKLAGGLWGLALITAFVFLILAIVGMSQATTQQNPVAHADARKKAVVSGVAFGCLAALGVIVGMLLTVFS